MGRAVGAAEMPVYKFGKLITNKNIDVLDVLDHTRVSMCAPAAVASSPDFGSYGYRFVLPCHPGIIPRFLHFKLDRARCRIRTLLRPRFSSVRDRADGSVH